MFEARHDLHEHAVADRPDDVLPAVAPVIAAQSPAQPEQRGFELPATIWQAMIACYAVFFLALATALGASGKAMLALVVAVVYVTIFFGVARIVMHQNPARERSPLDSTGVLATWCGPMDRKAVFGQILVVPFAVALFGIAACIIIIASGAAA